jgi:hypothetical protein
MYIYIPNNVPFYITREKVCNFSLENAASFRDTSSQEEVYFCGVKIFSIRHSVIIFL